MHQNVFLVLFLFLSCQNIYEIKTVYRHIYTYFSRSGTLCSPPILPHTTASPAVSNTYVQREFLMQMFYHFNQPMYKADSLMILITRQHNSNQNTRENKISRDASSTLNVIPSSYLHADAMLISTTTRSPKLAPFESKFVMLGLTLNSRKYFNLHQSS